SHDHFFFSSFFHSLSSFFFFFNNPAPPEIYTLSLHDALPICRLEHVLPATEDVLDAVAVGDRLGARLVALAEGDDTAAVDLERGDRKSTRLNSSHVAISYAVFCLKKKKKTTRG